MHKGVSGNDDTVKRYPQRITGIQASSQNLKSLHRRHVLSNLVPRGHIPLVDSNLVRSSSARANKRGFLNTGVGERVGTQGWGECSLSPSAFSGAG